MNSNQKFFMDEEAPRVSYQTKDYVSENILTEDTKKVINMYLQLSPEEKVVFNRHLREGKGYIL
mgnify:CR=1 FL=1